MAGGGGLLDVVTGGSRQVGNYFNILSGLTSVVVVGFPALLMAAGAPEHRPDVAVLARHLQAGFHLGYVVLFGLLVLVVGITIHPLQFGMTQLLEGYWGHGRLQRRAMERSQRRHTEQWWAITATSREARSRVDSIDEQLKLILKKRTSLIAPQSVLEDLDDEERELVDARIAPNLAWQQLGMAAARYPTNPDEVLPTRLGNMLRRHERLAGEPFGLDAVTVTPFLAQVAEEPEREYLNDARTALDLPVRMVLVWALCTLEGILLLWPYDFWLAVPLLTYALAWFAYRGAVSAASAYGLALGVVLTLGRRDLYERLSIEFPPDAASERDQNASLGSLLAGYPADVEFTGSAAFKGQGKRWHP
jgi:hypothetical protein